jgi:hypothetical protein
VAGEPAREDRAGRMSRKKSTAVTKEEFRVIEHYRANADADRFFPSDESVRMALYPVEIELIEKIRASDDKELTAYLLICAFELFRIGLRGIEHERALRFLYEAWALGRGLRDEEKRKHEWLLKKIEARLASKVN